MAKKSMIAKQKRTLSLKYKSIHVANAAVVRILYTANLNFAVFVSRELAYKGQIPGVKKASW